MKVLDHGNLANNYANQNHGEVVVVENLLKHIEISLSGFPTVNEVECLHEHEDIENDCEVLLFLVRFSHRSELIIVKVQDSLSSKNKNDHDK